jgi:xylulokinase
MTTTKKKQTIVLGIDCGTQSTKVLIYNADTKKVLAIASSPHQLISKAGGTREQKPEWWDNALKLALKKVSPKIKQLISAVGVSGQQHGFVALGENDKVLLPAKLWCDTATTAECEEITQRFGGAKQLISELGNPILAGYTASKVLWLKNKHPERYSKMRSILLPHDYLNFLLTGVKKTEHGDASGTGWLDLRTRTYSTKLLRTIDPERNLENCLPPLIDAHSQLGSISAEASKKYGIPQGIPVSVGGGDNMMGAIGTASNQEGFITVSLGTSGTVFGYADKPIIDPSGSLAAFCSSTGGYLPLLCTMNCTVATEVTRHLLETDIPGVTKLIEKSPIGSEGLITIPFFSGERSPNLPKARGSIFGMTNTNVTKSNLMRSSMESSLFGLKMGIEAFEKLGVKATEIRLIGGGAKNPIWRQMAANIFNLPIATPVQEEAAAFGAALQALWMLGSRSVPTPLSTVLEKHVRMNQKNKCKPHGKSAMTYQKVFQQYTHYLGFVEELYP